MRGQYLRNGQRLNRLGQTLFQFGAATVAPDTTAEFFSGGGIGCEVGDFDTGFALKALPKSCLKKFIPNLLFDFETGAIVYQAPCST